MRDLLAHLLTGVVLTLLGALFVVGVIVCGFFLFIILTVFVSSFSAF